MIKRIVCKIFGHKPKEYPPLKYWINGVGAVDSIIKPVFCSRCGCSQLEIEIDNGIIKTKEELEMRIKDIMEKV
jgi:hypothetical protein